VWHVREEVNILVQRDKNIALPILYAYR
jgi:hypothetical protein